MMNIKDSQTTHRSVFQKHLLEGHEVSKGQQHVKDVTWHLVFVLPADEREMYSVFSLIPI